MGVTGTDLDECFDVVRKRIFGKTVMPAVLKVVQDIDVSTLDQDQVLPNIEPPDLARDLVSSRICRVPYDLTLVGGQA